MVFVLRRCGPSAFEERVEAIRQWYGKECIPNLRTFFSYRHECGHRQDRPGPRPFTYQCAACQRMDEKWVQLDPSVPQGDSMDEEPMQPMFDILAVLATEECRQRRRIGKGEQQQWEAEMRRWRRLKEGKCHSSCRRAAVRSPTSVLAELTNIQATASTIHHLFSIYGCAVQWLAEALPELHVYLAVYDQQSDSLTYMYASENCASVMVGKRLQRQEAPNCPTFLSCLGEASHSALVKDVTTHPNVVIFGCHRVPGAFFVTPVLGLNHQPAAILGIDTAISDTSRRQTHACIDPHVVQLTTQVAASLSVTTATCQAEALLQGLHQYANGAATALLPVFQEACEAATAIIGPGTAAYVALFGRGGRILTMVTQAIEPGSLLHTAGLVGSRLTRRGAAFSLRENWARRGDRLYIHNVRQDHRARLFPGAGLELPLESLLLVGLTHATGRIVGVLGVECPPGAMDDYHKDIVSRIATYISEYTRPVWQRQHLQLIAPHAVAYLQALTHCPNVHMSATTPMGYFQCIAASPAQEHLIGTFINDDEGVLRALLEKSEVAGTLDHGGMPSSQPPHPEQSFHSETVMMAAIPFHSWSSTSPAEGAVLCCDLFGVNQPFTPFQQQLLERTSRYLKSAMLGSTPDPVYSPSWGISFAVEAEVGSDSVSFWRIVWGDICERLSCSPSPEVEKWGIPDTSAQPKQRVTQLAELLCRRGTRDVQFVRLGKAAMLQVMREVDPTALLSTRREASVVAAEQLIQEFSLEDIISSSGSLIGLMFEWICAVVVISRSIKTLQQQAESDLLQSLADEAESLQLEPSFTSLSSVNSTVVDNSIHDKQSSIGLGSSLNEGQEDLESPHHSDSAEYNQCMSQDEERDVEGCALAILPPTSECRGSHHEPAVETEQMRTTETKGHPWTPDASPSLATDDDLDSPVIPVSHSWNETRGCTVLTAEHDAFDYKDEAKTQAIDGGSTAGDDELEEELQEEDEEEIEEGGLVVEQEETEKGQLTVMAEAELSEGDRGEETEELGEVEGLGNEKEEELKEGEELLTVGQLAEVDDVEQAMREEEEEEEGEEEEEEEGGGWGEVFLEDLRSWAFPKSSKGCSNDAEGSWVVPSEDEDADGHQSSTDQP